MHEKRKTINGEDILTSMRALGFDNYEGVLKVYLAKYREVSCAPASWLSQPLAALDPADIQHQITQARLRQNQPSLLLDDEDGLKRGADDEDSDSRRKKQRGKKRDE